VRRVPIVEVTYVVRLAVTPRKCLKHFPAGNEVAAAECDHRPDDRDVEEAFAAFLGGHTSYHDEDVEFTWRIWSMWP
jgi:hypothetical protein